MAHQDGGGSSGPAPSPGGSGSPLVDKVDLGGSWLLHFLDGTTKVWPKDQAMPKSSTDNTVGLANVALGYAQLGQSGANSQQSAYMQALGIEEQRRQFNEQFGMDKAKFNISTGETQRQYNETFGYNKAKFNAEFGENQRQFNENFGYEKAKFNVRQQFEEAIQKWNEAKDARDFGAAEHWKGRADELSRMQFGEDQRQYNTSTGLDYYKHLGEMASNPRNFMQNFFINRGQEAPPGSEQFANTGQNLNAVKPFEQFLPGFIQAVMGGQGGQQYAQGGAAGAYGGAGGAGGGTGFGTNQSNPSGSRLPQRTPQRAMGASGYDAIYANAAAAEAAVRSWRPSGNMTQFQQSGDRPNYAMAPTTGQPGDTDPANGFGGFSPAQLRAMGGLSPSQVAAMNPNERWALNQWNPAPSGDMVNGAWVANTGPQRTQGGELISAPGSSMPGGWTPPPGSLALGQEQVAQQLSAAPQPTAAPPPAAFQPVGMDMAEFLKRLAP